MGLTNEQHARAVKWMQEKIKHPQCPSCGVNSWGFGQVTSNPLYKIESQIFPMLPLVCGECAYIKLFAAAPILGLD
jgi:hypothetical protein